jgi:antitoxin MazE
MLVSKWGNSLAIRLPKELVDELGLAAGDEVRVVKAGQGVIEIEIEKAERRGAALERMARSDWPILEGYAFDREEANRR